MLDSPMSVTEAARRGTVTKAPAQYAVTYEQPLKERMRVFMRLEFLFEQARHSLNGAAVWDSRAAVSSLLDIYSFFVRMDIRAEALKELERHTSTLQQLERTPGVDTARLEQVLGRLGCMMDQLHQVNGQLGASVRDSELLSSVTKRSCVPGGACSFDLPMYHHWLQRPAEARVRELNGWMAQFEPAERAISLMLALTRESADPTTEVATSGFFQRNLDSSIPWQLVRVTVPADLPYFPEISGGKHRFTVRFMRATETERPVQAEENVEFQLACCVI
jgi:cell division protein ZapD